MINVYIIICILISIVIVTNFEASENAINSEMKDTDDFEEKLKNIRRK